MLSTSNLGWINCDRFAEQRGKKSSLVVESDERGLKVSLVFHRIKSILRTYRGNSGAYVFSRVPVSEQVTLLVYKVKSGETLFYKENLVIQSRSQRIKVDLKPLTNEKLESIKNELDILH